VRLRGALPEWRHDLRLFSRRCRIKVSYWQHAHQLEHAARVNCCYPPRVWATSVGSCWRLLRQWILVVIVIVVIVIVVVAVDVDASVSELLPQRAPIALVAHLCAKAAHVCAHL